MLGIFTAIGSFIATVATTIGPAIVAAASALAAKLPTIIIAAKVVMDVIAPVISKVAEVLGIAPKDEVAEEIGAKRLQEGVRQRKEGETAQEYLDYLRKDVELDREKYNKMTEEEKLGCSIIGTTMIAESIEEKTGVEIPADFLRTIEKSSLNAGQVLGLLNSFAKNGITSMGEMTKYITNDLSESQAEKVDGAIREGLKENKPEMSEADIQQEVIEMKRSYNAKED